MAFTQLAHLCTELSFVLVEHMVQYCNAMENISVGAEFPNEPNKALLTPAQKSGKGKRLKAKYLVSSISEEGPRSVKVETLTFPPKRGQPKRLKCDHIASEEVFKKVGDNESGPSNCLRAPTGNPKRSVTLDIDVSREELSVKDDPSTPITVDGDPSAPNPEKVFKSEGIPLISRPGKHRQITALISVVILCVVVVMSAMSASGVFKKDPPPAKGSDVNGSGRNEVRIANANVYETHCLFPILHLNWYVLFQSPQLDQAARMR